MSDYQLLVNLLIRLLKNNRNYTILNYDVATVRRQDLGVGFWNSIKSVTEQPYIFHTEDYRVIAIKREDEITFTWYIK